MHEVSSLLEIKNHCIKHVDTLEDLATGNIDGIRIMSLVDFLLHSKY